MLVDRLSVVFRLMVCTACLASCENELPQTVPTSSNGGEFPSQNQFLSEKVFSEDVLNRWGYITTEVGERYHAIRSKKNYGSSNTAFYARFNLAKAKFKDRSDASATKNRIEAVSKTSVGFKDYTQIIQHESTLYSIRATSNYTFLSHQPKLLDLARRYLQGGGFEKPASQAEAK